MESVSCLTQDGQLGILANHAPIVVGLEIGVVRYGEKSGQKKKIAIGGGFMEMYNNKLTVMADVAELGSEIDVLRAQSAKERAERRLAEKEAEWDFSRARIALQKALTRLEAAKED